MLEFQERKLKRQKLAEEQPPADAQPPATTAPTVIPATTASKAEEEAEVVPVVPFQVRSQTGWQLEWGVSYWLGLEWGLKAAA